MYIYIHTCMPEPEKDWGSPGSFIVRAFVIKVFDLRL